MDSHQNVKHLLGNRCQAIKANTGDFVRNQMLLQRVDQIYPLVAVMEVKRVMNYPQSRTSANMDRIIAALNAAVSAQVAIEGRQH